MKKWFGGLSKGKKILVIGAAAFFGLTAIGVASGGSSSKNNVANPDLAKPITSQVKSAETEKKVEVKTETKTEVITFESTTQNDNSLSTGTTIVSVAGVNGVKTITYKVTYTDGTETGREKTSEAVTTQPVTQITKIGTKVATPSTGSSCSGGYINSAGDCVPSPSSNPSGATAKCGDGTYSYSQSRSGTCSHHGGVATWL